MAQTKSGLPSVGLLFLTAVLPAQTGEGRNVTPGHSLHGEAFDEGPRQQAWKMPGVGDVAFPITTSNAEAQAFFNQGVAQLHTFYYFEAERSFRQTAFLDPECPMAYWGMAMANQNNGKRAEEFLSAARRRIAKATDRERKYIEALEAYYNPSKGDADRRLDYVKGLETVVLAYGEDIEAKAFLAWTVVGNSWRGDKISSHVAVDLLIAEVLRKAPLHPGAHHYRIHLWDNRDPAQALLSAKTYARAAPGIAHAWHMPGHIYNGVSQWKNAVYQQASSACVDHKHMYDHSVLPFQIHNYAHNQHYLIANLSHLGGVHDAIDYARNLVETPRDPGVEVAQSLGRASLMRILLRYERWDELLQDPHLEWGDTPEQKGWKAYSRGFAFLGKGDFASVALELSSLEKLADEAATKPGQEADVLETIRSELKGRLRVREGKLLEGFALLAKGQKLQAEKTKGDPGGHPRPFLESVGQAHLEAQNWGLAEDCFRAVLADREHTLVSLAGLAEALHRRGKLKETREAYAQFMEAWKDADQDLPHARRLADLGVAIVRSDNTGSTRAFVTAGELLRLEKLNLPPLPEGSRLWAPSPAPLFALSDSKGARVSLESFRGKYVLLSFYLGGSCSHCVEQLVAMGKEKDSFERLGIQALGISDDTPEKSLELLAGPKGPSIPFPLLSDPDRKVARGFGAHDTFEDLALHGLYLLDWQGGIRWSRVSAQPFMNIGFVTSEVERLRRLGVK